MFVSPSVIFLQMITALVESMFFFFFWARSDPEDLGEGGAKPQGWFFSSSEGREPRGHVLLFKGAELCS